MKLSDFNGKKIKGIRSSEGKTIITFTDYTILEIGASPNIEFDTWPEYVAIAVTRIPVKED